MELQLTVKYTDGRSKVYTLDNSQEYWIGRDEGIQIRLEDSNVSGHHARIFFNNGQFFCEDGYNGKPSRNGTWLNKRRITESIRLKKNDTLLIGTCQIVINEILLSITGTHEIPLLRGKYSLTMEDIGQLAPTKWNMRLKKILWMIAAVLVDPKILILAALLLSFLLYRIVSGNIEVPAVDVITVREKVYEFPFYFSTFALPGRNFTLDSPVSGKVVEIYKKVGDTIRKDEMLLKLDDNQEKTKVEQLKSQYDILKLRIGDMEENVLKDLKEKRQQLDIEITNVSQELGNYQKIYLTGKGDVRHYNLLKDKYEKLNQELKEVRETYKSNLQKLTILQKEADLAKNSYEEWVWKLKERVITSPVDGYVKDLPIVVGSYIQQGKPVCRIVDISIIKLCLYLPENEFPNWQVKQKLTIYFEQIPRLQFEGEILSIAFRNEGETPVFETVIDITNSEENIKPGMNARIEYFKKNLQGGFYIPASCIVNKSGKPFVYLVKDGRSFIRYVTLWGYQPQKNIMLVIDGINPNDTMIQYPSEELEENTPVKIKKK